MSHLEILSIFFLLSFISCVVAYDNRYTTFFSCISINSQEPNILQRFYTPNSQSYKSSLDFAEKNRRWFNSTNQQPYLIMTPNSQSEIRPLILCSKKLGFQVRAKSGGHDYEGLSFRSEMNTPFVMIDLVNLTQIEIDVEKETALIETGVTLGQLYYAIANKSNTLAFPGGLYPSIGTGGIISGGGLGTMMRKYGLAADNVIDALIMDVDGNILNREQMGEDLFWAIRGGGGASFGVILSWKLKLVRVPEHVTGFTIYRKLEYGPELELLQKWQNNAYKLPKELFIRTIIGNFPTTILPGEGQFAKILYNGLYLGPADELVSILNTNFPEFNIQPQDYVQTSWIGSIFYFTFLPTDTPRENLLVRTKSNNYEKATSDFLSSPIPDEGWEMIREMTLSVNGTMLILDPFGGEMDEISENSIPFPHRSGTLYSVQYMAHWNGSNNEAEAPVHIEWIRDMYQKMEPYVSSSPRSAYLNYKDLGLGGNDQNCSFEHAKVWGEKYFKGNFERLARVKGKVDPDNFFRNEQSIPVLV